MALKVKNKGKKGSKEWSETYLHVVKGVAATQLCTQTNMYWTSLPEFTKVAEGWPFWCWKITYPFWSFTILMECLLDGSVGTSYLRNLSAYIWLLSFSALHFTLSMWITWMLYLTNWVPGAVLSHILDVKSHQACYSEVSVIILQYWIWCIGVSFNWNCIILSVDSIA